MSTFISATPIQGAGPTTGASMAVAGAYRCFAAGAEAPFFNPANLALHDAHRWGIHFLGIGASVDNSAFSIASYSQYNGRYWDEADKAALLNRIPAEGLILNGHSAMQPLSVRYGPVAFSTGFVAAARGSIAKDIFTLLLQGNELGYEYKFRPATAEAIVMTSYTFSYATSFLAEKSYLQRLAVGINVKYLYGHFYGRTNHMQARACTEFTALRADGVAQMRAARGGNGFSFDLGLTGELSDSWRTTLTLENIGAQIRWHKQTEGLRADFVLDDTNVDEIIQADKEWEDVVTHRDTTYAIAAFTTHLPMVVNLGAMYHKRRWAIAAEYSVGVRSSAMSSTRGRLALGGEYRPWTFLPLRLGLSVGGESKFLFAYGLGLRIKAFSWHLGAQHVGGVIPSQSRGLGFASNFSLNF
ncbi:hypothetical protein JXO59_08755 [candidate division KSB1 bacterium]|nr:hypothetical protein [candidate division KSB1 bacterium]